MTELTSNPLLKTYTDFKQVGVGGMGEVYQAFDTLHNRTIAIKRFNTPQSQTRLEARERLLREAKVSFELNHPNLAGIYEVIDTDDSLFIIRPYYEGIALDDKLNEGHLPKEEAIELFSKLCLGLQHAHNKNIFHRDIKPANIFILENGSPVLMDFGLAKASSLFAAGLTQTGSIIGTLDYLSPERVKGLDNDHRSDIWALGIVLFEMLTGEKPFGKSQEISATILKIITSPTPALSDFGGPEELEPLIHKMLAKNVEKRYQDIDELLHDFEIIKSGKSISFDSSISLQTDLPIKQIHDHELKISNPNNLPRSAKAFVGRENELKLINYYLASDESKLITIVGSGGNGKTGLSLKVAEQQCTLPTFTDGIYFVSLESINTALAIPSAIAEALNFDFSGTADPTDQLITHLTDKRIMLALDNVDHLTKELNIILKIISACKNVKILCTSRTKLGLDAEWLVYLNGLNLPTIHQHVSLNNAKDYDSISLFEKRARRNKASFTLSENNLKDIIKICRIVDGSPLGIELAASWIRLLSSDRILKEVQKNFDFLDSHGGQGKHKSMRAVFEYSWNLLGDLQKDCLRGLTVFQGGFTLDAVNEVSGTTKRNILELLDASLVQEIDEKLFDLQPLVKQYASEKANENLELRLRTEQEHCKYYISKVVKDKLLIRGEDQDIAIQNIEVATENIYKALDWSLKNNYNIDLLFQAIEVMRRFFTQKGRFKEGISILEEILELSYTREENLQLSGHLKAHIGNLKVSTNELSAATQLSKDAIKILKPKKDYSGMLLPINTLGMCEANKGNYSKSIYYFKYCMNIANTLSHEDEAMYINNLAIAEQFAGNYQRASNHMHHALDLSRKLRLSTLELNITINIGSLMLALKQPHKAISFLEDSLELIKNLESNHLIPYTLHNLGIANSQLGNYQDAKTHYFKALDYVEQSGQIDLEIILCADIAKVYLSERDLPATCEYLNRSFKLSLQGQHTQYSLRSIIYWAEYLIVSNKIEEGISYLYFLKGHSALTQEDDEIVTKTLRVVKNHVENEILEQAKLEACKFELEPLLESILNADMHVPLNRTIDSTQLTTSL